MKNKTLLYNARILTQDHGLTVNSMALTRGKIVAVGDNLQRLDDFKKYDAVDLGKRAVIPGLVDAHTHFYYYALSLGRVELHGIASIDGCLAEIGQFAAGLKKDEWIVGEGYAPDLFAGRVEPDRAMLDSVSGGRPAFIFSKDQHSAWVNTRALELAGITKATTDPVGGRIERLADGSPSGLLREGPAYSPVFDCIKQPSQARIDRLYRQALEQAYSRGVTGVHSFDGPDGFAYFTDLAEKGKLGLRITYYVPGAKLAQVGEAGITYGTGDDFLRVAGVKLFADGSLGSRSALCFQAYKDFPGNRGIEVMSSEEIEVVRARRAATLGLPCAVHAIGDQAVANVLDALESAPLPKAPARHRIEHLQLVRRKDIARILKLNAVASMQPQQTISDIAMSRRAFGTRTRDTYIFRTLLDRGVDLAFGSDVPIERLDPLAGIAGAVRRARPGSRDIFHPEQRITAEEALFGFTVGPAIAAGQEHCRGYLLPGYPADFVVLSHDITRIAPMRIHDVSVLATVLDGKIMYHDQSFSL